MSACGTLQYTNRQHILEDAALTSRPGDVWRKSRMQKQIWQFMRPGMWRDLFRSAREQKQTVEAPKRIPIRSTRFRLDLPVSFVADGRTYDGQSLNVSDSGLLARCDQLPELWTDGQLCLEAAEHFLNINARVARLQENNVGFAFSPNSENDRAAIKVLIDSVLDRPLTSEDLPAVS